MNNLIIILIIICIILIFALGWVEGYLFAKNKTLDGLKKEVEE